MQYQTQQRGIAGTPLLIGVLAVIIIGATVAYVATNRTTAPAAEQGVGGTPDDVMMEKEGEAMVDDEHMDDAMMEESGEVMNDDVMMKEGEAAATTTFSGQVLAGSSAPLLEYNAADYNAALQSNKLVVLYFYANWCPDCRAEFPLMQQAFNQLTGEQVVGFRVNFNDSDTTDEEKQLARQYGVPYQHTKVFVKNGQQILKSPEAWDTARYLQEINGAL